MKTIFVVLTGIFMMNALICNEARGHDLRFQKPKLSKPCTAATVQTQILSLSNPRLKARRKAAGVLIAWAATCQNSSIVGKELTRRLEFFCLADDSVAKSKDFQEFSEVLKVISRLKYIPALKTVITCVNQASVTSGLSNAHFPARAALRKFGQKAIPDIKDALLNGAENIKCPLIESLVEIGGKDALDALKTTTNVMQGPEVKRCTEKGLELLNLYEKGLIGVIYEVPH